MANENVQRDPIPEDPMSKDPNVGEDTGYMFPAFEPATSVPHYYGDYVRQLFLVSGGAILVVAPFAFSSRFEGRFPFFEEVTPFLIVGALTLVTLGAMTSPRKPWVMLADAVVSAIGVLVWEMFAVAAFRADSFFRVIFFEALVVGFLLSLYYSVKTYRAMTGGILGRKPSVDEFVGGN